MRATSARLLQGSERTSELRQAGLDWPQELARKKASKWGCFYAWFLIILSCQHSNTYATDCDSVFIGSVTLHKHFRLRNVHQVARYQSGPHLRRQPGGFALVLDSGHRFSVKTSTACTGLGPEHWHGRIFRLHVPDEDLGTRWPHEPAPTRRGCRQKQPKSHGSESGQVSLPSWVSTALSPVSVPSLMGPLARGQSRTSTGNLGARKTSLMRKPLNLLGFPRPRV